MYPDSFHQNATFLPSPAPEALTALHEYQCGLDMSKHRSLKLCALSIQALGQICLTPTKVYSWFKSCRITSNRSSPYLTFLLLFSLSQSYSVWLVSIVENIAETTLGIATLYSGYSADYETVNLVILNQLLARQGPAEVTTHLAFVTKWCWKSPNTPEGILSEH